VYSVRDSGSQPNTPGWRVRVVPNKYPALRVEGGLDRRGDGVYDAMNGVGAHEVIIETPDHGTELEDQSESEIRDVLLSYRIRMLDLMRDGRLHYILVFKNVGRSAGASLAHPHSQLIATSVTPKRVREKLGGAQQYFLYKDRSIFADILRQELKDGERVVYRNDRFVAFCPYASRFPFEVCIMPVRHHPDFHSIREDEAGDLASVLREVLLRIKRVLRGPQYNMIVHTGPVRYPHPGYWATIDDDFCWHIEIMPRVTQIAGFEWGTGFYINPTIPEECARYLRENGDGSESSEG
jgi:UDPglucose--hexose-1-phosphate uridylyltransferase